MKKLHICVALLFVLSLLGFLFRFHTGVSTDALNPIELESIRLYTPVIDPGHGGFDGGAVSVTGHNESNINLDIALKTELLFRFMGMKPVMTRSTDTALDNPEADTVREKKRTDLQNRVKLINAVDNAFLISIHQNKFTQAQYSGAQTFHNGKPDSIAMAEIVQKMMIAELDPQNNRQIKKAEDVYIMDNAKGNAVLVECGFLSNNEEAARLLSPDYQLKLAMVICASYMQWKETK